MPFASGELELLPALAEQFLRPAVPFAVQWCAGTAPATRSIADDVDDRLVISALRPAETFSPGVMLHAHNPTRVELNASIHADRARLDETPLPGGALLRPFEVAAWRVR